MQQVWCEIAPPAHVLLAAWCGWKPAPRKARAQVEDFASFMAGFAPGGAL